MGLRKRAMHEMAHGAPAELLLLRPRPVRMRPALCTELHLAAALPAGTEWPGSAQLAATRLVAHAAVTAQHQHRPIPSLQHRYPLKQPGQLQLALGCKPAL